MYLQRAARAMARLFDDALRPVGLTNGQFSILMSLNRPDTPKMKEVADLLALDRTTLTANLKPLERRGLVTVLTDETDRRSRRLALTKDGRTLLTEAYPIWEATHREAEKRLVACSPDALRAGLTSLS
jgi:DNA-binding MarR family transcriptional regulator